jgi:hypothetical protein
MSNLREYPIYKKRDGKGFEYVSYIYSDSFTNAKKEFAKLMTSSLWETSNNITWLDSKLDGVKESGWYDLDASIFGFTHSDNGDTEGEPVYKEGIMELYCSEKDIKKGFAIWYEDVYTWELRKN